MSNGINDMTSFELNILTNYITVNDILFNMRKEEINQIRNICNKTIKERMLQDPNIETTVELSYVKMVSEVVDDIRKESTVAEEIIQQVARILNQYYGMIFSKLQMVQGANGTLSSYDLCLNYRNCKVAAEELAIMLKQKEQLQRK